MTLLIYFEVDKPEKLQRVWSYEPHYMTDEELDALYQLCRITDRSPMDCVSGKQIRFYMVELFNGKFVGF
jgi:hypothetical protein